MHQLYESSPRRSVAAVVAALAHAVVVSIGVETTSAADGEPKTPSTSTCTAGNDNFSDDAEMSQPTTFSGGTIHGPYGTSGGIAVVDTVSGRGKETVARETHLLRTGFPPARFLLRFTNAVSSVQVDASSRPGTALSLGGFDSSGVVVASDRETADAGSILGLRLTTLSIKSATNSIKAVIIETNDEAGLAFSNLVWGCRRR
jgi:hypothetical protein